MPTAIHSFSQEEIMAFLDGELSPERAQAASQHLEQCRDCQRLAADLRTVSQSLTNWEIAPLASLPPQVPVQEPKKPRLFWRPPLVLGAGVAAVSVLITAVLVHSNSTTAIRSVPHYMQSNSPEMLAYRSDSAAAFVREQKTPQRSGGRTGQSDIVIDGANAAPPLPPSVPAAAPSGPLIVRTAQLSVTSKNFDQSRTEIDRITRARQGYISDLELSSPNGAGRTLTATLRIPAAQVDAMLRELRLLGQVNEESQNGEDVTRRYVDSSARLANLRTTEERLLQILRDRTGRLADVLQVEEAVDRTRGEIETAEAEQKLLSTQIKFATVNLRISEEYKAQLQVPDASPSTGLRNAAVAGYRNVVDLATGLVEFLLSAGPVLLIVAGICFFPARWLWRRHQTGLWPFAH